MLKDMKMKIFLLAVALSIAHFAVNAQTFKVVGYYSLKAATTADPANVPFDQLTHVNLYFLNPDTLGNFKQDLSGLERFIKAAHKKNVKVLASIAGGGRHPYYHRLLMDDKRGALVKALLDITLQYKLDGIDVDIEGKDIDSNYESFAVELAAALHPHNKLVTAAIAVFYKDDFTDKALAQYDFVNVMSYDHTYPTNWKNPGQHSGYQHAVSDLAYFGVERKIPKEKMVLGVPFYGYGFGPDSTSAGITMNYLDIATQFPGASQKDEWKVPSGATVYYNGIPTIKQKTALAKEKAAGIMIWQLSGDKPGAESLLKAINEESRK
jgi:chitinase